MKHRILALCIILLLVFTAAIAEEAAPIPTIHDMGLELMGSSVCYPHLTGLADPAVQTAVNAAIMDKGQINARLSRMAALMNAPVKLNVSYTCTLKNDVFSCAILADGAVETTRATQVWSTVTLDLADAGSYGYALLQLSLIHI